jgi:hypothetical protein
MSQPEPEQQTNEVTASERGTHAGRKPVVAEFYIYFCPDGKSGERIKKGSLPLDVDFEEHIDERTDLDAGLYRIEKRKSGLFPKDICYYTKPAMRKAMASYDAPDDDDDVDLLETSEPPRSSLPDDFDERVAEIASRAVVAALEKREQLRGTQPAPQQPDPFAFIERSLEIEEKMRARSVRNNPAPPEVKDSSEQFIDMLDRFTTIAERIAPIRETDKENSGGLLGGLASLIREAAPHAKSFLPMLPSLLPQPQAQVPAANGSVPLPPIPNRPPPASETAEPLQLALSIIVDDLRKNKRVGRAADAVDELFLRQPELREQFAPFFDAPAVEIVTQLSALAGEDLSAYSHAVGWIEDLQFELNGNNAGDEATESTEENKPTSPEPFAIREASNNGHKGADIAKTA